jgi:hypothetical protein
MESAMCSALFQFACLDVHNFKSGNLICCCRKIPFSDQFDLYLALIWPQNYFYLGELRFLFQS